MELFYWAAPRHVLFISIDAIFFCEKFGFPNPVPFAIVAPVFFAVVTASTYVVSWHRTVIGMLSDSITPSRPSQLNCYGPHGTKGKKLTFNRDGSQKNYTKRYSKDKH